MSTQLEHPDAWPPAHSPALWGVAEVALIGLVFFAIAGDPPPHVNEAHYLAKLKHIWNPQWCAGDLFLESRDAQFAFAWLFGWITRWLSLPTTAWVGRILAWGLLAWSFRRLSWRLIPVPLAAVLSAALFVALNARFNLAGEWIVGGVESKCFAYVFVLLALRELVDLRWNRMWLLLGAATALHPIVGGWSALACGGVLAWNVRSVPTWRSMLPAMFGCAMLASFGVVPALLLTWHDAPEIGAEASRIYVFERLPHHLAILSLPSAEIARRLGGHGALLVVLWFASRRDRSSGLRWIAQFAWGAALLALIGFAVEAVLWERPALAARILRYYWFRLTDFGAPLGVALYWTSMAAKGAVQGKIRAPWLLAAAVIFAGGHIAVIVQQRYAEPIAPAESKVRDVPAWIEACEWISANTPVDSLFLTPRLNHTFKWHASRPEVVNRKDIPQDASGIVEWNRRIKTIYYRDFAGREEPLDSIGILGTERVRELARQFGADFVLMDRGQLLSLPIEFWNEEYVVYRIDKSGTSDSK